MTSFITDSLSREDKIKAFDNIKARFEIEGGRLELVSEARYAAACDIIAHHFLPDEPLSQAFDVQWHPVLQQNVLDNLVQGLSIMAVFNDTDEVMGVRLCGAMKETDVNDLGSVQYDNLRELNIFLGHKDKEVDFYNVYGVKEAMHLYTLGVNRKFRRRGLGTVLMAAMLAFAKKLGYTAIKGEGTSNFSQRIYEKHGFQTLYELPYDSYMHNGDPVVNKTGEHKKTRIYGMAL